MSSSVLSVRLNPKTKAKLEALAKASRRSRSFLAAEAIENYVESEAWQLAEIEAGIDDLNATDREGRPFRLMEEGRPLTELF